MIDIITIVGVWIVSLVSAFVSVRQSKGVDWYAPIGYKQKMIMTLVNISIGLLVMILAFLIIPGQQWKVVVISVVCIIIILLFSLPTILKKIKKENTNKEENKEKDTLLDIFSKILTVFNAVFLLMNIAYMLYTYENIKIIIKTNESVLKIILNNNDVLLIHGTILIWTTMSAIVITKNGWEYHETVENNFEEKKRKKHNASFFAKRITNRNG